MSRGKGVKSKIKGRISGYETADFSIVSSSEQVSQLTMDSKKKSSIDKEKKKMPILKKIGIVLGCIIVIPIASLLIIGVIIGVHDSMSENTYAEPKVITPESSDIKPTSFTQRQLEAEYARDENIAELLKDEWTIKDNAMASDYYITVGKKWEAIRSNPSPILNISTSYEYDPKDQKYETSSVRINLQEIKENAGIIVDSTVTNIIKVYNPSINVDSINSSVQAAYNSTLNSKPYKGSLSFDKDTVYISGDKNGQLINVTIQVSTSLVME